MMLTPLLHKRAPVSLQTVKQRHTFDTVSERQSVERPPVMCSTSGGRDVHVTGASKVKYISSHRPEKVFKARHSPMGASS